MFVCFCYFGNRRMKCNWEFGAEMKKWVRIHLPRIRQFTGHLMAPIHDPIIKQSLDFYLVEIYLFFRFIWQICYQVNNS